MSDKEYIDKLTADQKLFIVEQVLSHIASDIQLTEQSFKGTEEFESVSIKDIFTDVKRNYTILDNDAKFGRSQKGDSESLSRYHLDLSKED